MRFRRKLELIFWMVTLSALPARANNPPQPDGLFSLILIFPIIIFGFRLAGASYTDSERRWRLLRGLLLALAVLFGKAAGGIPLLAILIFGFWRGIQITKRGQGKKRFLIGAFVWVWTLFALSDYVISMLVYSPVPYHELDTVRNLRYLAQAEQAYAKTNAGGQFATIKQLQDAKTPLPTEFSGEGGDSNPALYDLYLNDNVYVGYRFNSVVEPDGKRFLITAMPATYRKRLPPMFVPGTSLFLVLRSSLQKESPPQHSEKWGQRTFAIDETGVVRAADLGTTRPVTREEAEQWKPVGAN